MTQLLIDRATLEQLVVAAQYLTQIVLTNITDYPIETEQRITDWNTHQDAIASGRAALAQQELPQKERPDFMAGYDAGFKAATGQLGYCVCVDGVHIPDDVVKKAVFLYMTRDMK